MNNKEFENLIADINDVSPPAINFEDRKHKFILDHIRRVNHLNKRNIKAFLLYSMLSITDFRNEIVKLCDEKRQHEYARGDIICHSGNCTDDDIDKYFNNYMTAYNQEKTSSS